MAHFAIRMILDRHGITDEDMYIETLDWRFAYTAYDPPQRVGVVSSARFVPVPLAGNEKLLRARVRKW